MKRELEDKIAKLKSKYTLNEAKDEIEQILITYSPNCKIEFYEDNAEITDSYLVTNMQDRQVICEIIRRTGITNRDYEDLSAEWEFHNVSYNLHFKRKSAKDVNLDYTQDPRKAVQVATSVFKSLKIE